MSLYNIPPHAAIILFYNFIAITSVIQYQMGTCRELSILALVSVCLGTVVMFHHFHRHSQRGDIRYINDPDDRWFQVMHVAHFQHNSHAMWVLRFLLLGASFRIACI